MTKPKNWMDYPDKFYKISLALADLHKPNTQFPEFKEAYINFILKKVKTHIQSYRLTL